MHTTDGACKMTIFLYICASLCSILNLIAADIEPIEVNCSSTALNKWFTSFQSKLVNNYKCEITSGGKTLTKLSGIQFVNILDLSYNALTDIPDYSLKNFSALEKLNLENNELESLNRYSFKGLNHLTFLDLSYNNFVVLNEEWFRPLVSLSGLEINFCKVKYFVSDTFTWPDKLLVLSLINNDISVMPPLPLETVADPRWKIYLQGNPIHCGCRRKEHNSGTLTMHAFGHIYLGCNSRQCNKNNSREKCVDSYKDMKGRRLVNIWDNYVRSSVCEAVSLQHTVVCSLGARCQATCMAKNLPLSHVGLALLWNQTKNDTSVEETFSLADTTKVTCSAKDIIDSTLDLEGLDQIKFDSDTDFNTSVDSSQFKPNDNILFWLISVTLAISVISNIVFFTLAMINCGVKMSPDSEDMSEYMYLTLQV